MELYQILCLCGIPALAGMIWGYLSKKLSKLHEEQEVSKKQTTALQLGVQALLRDRLLQSYHYYALRGWADADERSNFLNLYSQYHALGANGVMDDIKRRFMELPLDDPEGRVSFVQG